MRVTIMIAALFGGPLGGLDDAPDTFSPRSAELRSIWFR